MSAQNYALVSLSRTSCLTGIPEPELRARLLGDDINAHGYVMKDQGWLYRFLAAGKTSKHRNIYEN